MNKTIKRVKARLEHWFGLADARHVWAGKAWYREAHEFAVELSTTYDILLFKVVGVIAALSPSVYWNRNKIEAENLCQAYADDGELAGVVLSTYGRQAEKARRILHLASEGSVINLLGRRAFKTKAFFFNILRYPGSWYVTIDQHIIVAAGFEAKWVSGSQWCYNLLATAIEQLAVKHGLQPYEMQAILWVTYKAVTNPEVEEEIPF